MYISDKDVLKYVTRLILILLPIISSLFGIWSWIVEIALLFAIFIHHRNSGLRLTQLLMLLGYLGAFFVAEGDIFAQIGFSPWAGVFFLVLKEKGLTTSKSMFWGLSAAALLSALPVVPIVKTALNPDFLDGKFQEILNFYKEQGTLAALEKQGMPILEFESYLKRFVSIYYMLLPAVAGIMGMVELGVAYLVYRISLKKEYAVPPFSLWHFPWYAVWGVISGIAIYLSGNTFGVELMEIIGLNIMVIMAAIALIIGLSCLAYFIKHPKVPRFMTILLIFAGIFLPTYVLMALVLTGFFDLVINFRKIPDKLIGGKQ